MSDIWIVLVDDRHSTDVDAFPFSSEKRAVEVAREQIEANAAHPESVDWVTDTEPPEPGDEVVFFATYGDANTETVTVVRRTLDGEP